MQTLNLSFSSKQRSAGLYRSSDVRNSSVQRNGSVVCMLVPPAQAKFSKVEVGPVNLEDAKEPPLNIHKPKEPYTATIVSVERLVGPQAPGETCHIVIDHEGNVPYWEGQSYGIIPPVSIQSFLLFSFPEFLSVQRSTSAMFNRDND